jgi:hypothetical protein
VENTGAESKTIATKVIAGWYMTEIMGAKLIITNNKSCISTHRRVCKKIQVNIKFTVLLS